MGVFQDAVDQVMGILFSDKYADQVIYNGVPIYAHVRYGGGSTGTIANTAVIEVRRADVVSPEYLDTVVIDGANWRVFHSGNQEAVIKGDAWTWQIPVKKNEKPGFR